MDSVWQTGTFHYALSMSTLLYILKKSQLILGVLNQYFPIVPLDSASTNSENDENHGLGALAGRFKRNCNISVLKLRLARSSGVSPRLKANLSPKIRMRRNQLKAALLDSQPMFPLIPQMELECRTEKTDLLSVFRQHPLNQTRINLLGNNTN